MKVSGKQDDKMKRKIRGGWDDEEEESKPSCNKQATEKKPWGSQGINSASINKSDNVESKNQESLSNSNNNQTKNGNNNKESKETTKESSKNFYPPM